MSWLQVIVLAATNRANALDDALIRPGRFDRVVYMGAPTRNGRYKVLQASTQSSQSMLSPSALLQLRGKRWSSSEGLSPCSDLAALLHCPMVSFCSVDSIGFWGQPQRGASGACQAATQHSQFLPSLIFVWPLQVHAEGKPIDRSNNDAVLQRMADLAVGLTGAELANALNEAAIMAVGGTTLTGNQPLSGPVGWLTNVLSACLRPNRCCICG